MHQKINSTWVLIANTAVIACLLFVCSSAISATSGVNNVASLPPSNGSSIYKMVDANGRVTYTNSPIKGANKVELDPITVIPATPAGVLGDGQTYGQNSAKVLTQVAPPAAAQNAPQNGSQASSFTAVAAVVQSAPPPLLIPVSVAPTIAQPEEPTPMPSPAKAFPTQSSAPPMTGSSQPLSTKPIATAVVTTPAAVHASTSATKLPVVKLSPPPAAPVIPIAPDATVLPTNANVAMPSTPVLAAIAPTAPIFAATPTPSLRTTHATISPSATTAPTASRLQPTTPLAPVTSKNQAANTDQQQRLLATAKAQLAEEQRASESFRALRARLPAVIDQTNPAKAAIQNDIKTQVEQHFEKIRSLQDQISQYEQNLAALQQPAPGQKSLNKPPVQKPNTVSAAVKTADSQ